MFFKNSKYDEALEYLDENHPFFMKYVTQMGKPEYSTDVEYCAIRWIEDKGKKFSYTSKGTWQFVFNPEFEKTLEIEDFVFLSGHEALHIALKHSDLFLDNQDYFDDLIRFNLATDCVINDILYDIGLEVTDALVDKLPRGENCVGYNCYNTSVFDVYRDLPDDLVEQMRKQAEESQNGGGEGSPQDGSGEPYPGGGGAHLQGDEGDKKDGGPSTAEGKTETDRKIDQSKEKDEQAGRAAGTSFELRKINKVLEAQSKGWKTLLQKVDPDILNVGGPKAKTSWHRRPKKLSAMNDPYGMNGIMPIREVKHDKKGEKPTIVMFMDCSGSCASWTPSFIKLANSVPKDKINLMVYTFSTYTVRLDLEKDNQTYASGGTAFDPLEATIQKDVVKELGHYPKSVVVVTDGEAGFYNQPAKEVASSIDPVVL